MALPIPALANRDFDQIVSEGRALLPRLAPHWSDYNTSDPGITLMELLGSRLEQTLYRLDRTPAALARGFARRVGVAPLAAQVAEAVLLVAAQNAPLVLAAGTQVGAADGAAIFQTAEALALSPAVLVRVVAESDVTAANQAGDAPWLPFGAEPAPGSALYLGFDRPLGTAGSPVRLYSWSADPAGDRELRARLIAEQEAMQADAAHCAAGCSPAASAWDQHYSVRTAWEFYNGGAWAALKDVVDTTRAFSLSGAIEFKAPAGHLPGGPDPLRFFIRCRLLRGSYECPPRLCKVAHNAVAARHAVDIAQPEVLGKSLGHACARYPLGARPVVPNSTALVVATASGPDTSWSEVASWDASGAHDKHYLLDAAAGTITGGNGALARVFAADALLTISYRVGGGAGGNLAPRTLVRAVDSALNSARYQAANGGASPDWSKLAVRQPFQALGGADAEDPDTTKTRAFAAAFDMNRAVTCDDFERLAKEVPGVPVARAHALANYHPSLPCIDAAGCVSVIVVPACPGYRALPSDDFLAAVQRYLDRRRTLTTEVHVRPPSYLQLELSATLCTDGRAGAAQTQAAAAAALARFFDPLHGGPAGDGWPIGRSVYRSEVLAILSQVPGVAAVSGLALAGQGEPAPHCGNIDLCPDTLVRLGVVDIQVIGPVPLPIIDRSKPHDCP
jgi:predicted phage baseplate assembly protein